MKKMVESNVLQLTEKHLVTNHISLYIGYSKNCIQHPEDLEKSPTQQTLIEFCLKNLNYYTKNY